MATATLKRSAAGEVDHLSKPERGEANRLARTIERTINGAAGQRVATCSPPMTFMLADHCSLDDDLKFGMTLVLESIELVFDYRDKPRAAIAIALEARGQELLRCAAGLRAFSC